MRHFDRDVASRQAFGPYLNATSQDPRLVADLAQGKLHLSPHEPWNLPTELTWREDPFGQRNWVFQLHMLRWLDPLRRAGGAGDKEAASLWMRHIRSWIVANPPGRGKSKYAWSDMVDGIRALVLVLGLPIVPNHELDLVLDSLDAHGEWLADERHLGHSNHALHQHQGLFVVGAALRKRAWQDLAVGRLAHLLQTSYDEQGTNAEGALGYHRNNLIWWSHAMRRLTVEGVDLPSAANRLALGAKSLAHATRPDGVLEMIGDTATTRPTAIDSPYLDYVLSQGSKGCPPDETTLVLDRGYVFSRSGWGEFERDFDQELFWTASFGAANRVHGHADGGSLTLFAGRPWLVDSGKYAYIADEMSDYVKGRAAHNVVTIRDRAYDPTSVVSLTSGSIGEDLDDFTFTDGGYDGVTLTRRVVYCKGGDFLLVIDGVHADADVVADQLWHLDPDVRVTRLGRGVVLKAGDASAHLMWAGNFPKLATLRGSTDPFQGWTSRAWAEKSPSEVVIATKQGRRFRYLTILAMPRSGGFTVDSVHAIPSGLTASVTSGQLKFHLHVQHQSSNVHVGNRPAHFDVKAAAAPARRTPVQALGDLLERRPGSANDIPTGLEYVAPRELSAVARRRVREAGGGTEARLAFGAALLERLRGRESAPEGRDFGLRAALLDVLGADLLSSAGLAAADLGWHRQPVVRWRPQDSLSHLRYRLPLMPADEILASPKSAFAQARIGVFEEGGLVMPFVVRGGSTDTLVARFHGALLRSRVELPMFQGLSTQVGSAHAFLNFQDPTLDLDYTMNLAWFLGRAGVDLYDALAGVIQSVADRLGLGNIVLVGSSGGGYTALQVVSRVEGAHALAFNPQTDLSKYPRATVAKAMQAAFGVDEPDDLAEELRSRTSVITRWAEASTSFTATVVHNSGDEHHNTLHVGPLREYVSSRRDLRTKVNFSEVHLGRGHVAAPPELVTLFLEEEIEQLRKSTP